MALPALSCLAPPGSSWHRSLPLPVMWTVPMADAGGGARKVTYTTTNRETRDRLQRLHELARVR
jgi:hypothetical protein